MSSSMSSSEMMRMHETWTAAADDDGVVVNDVADCCR